MPAASGDHRQIVCSPLSGQTCALAIRREFNTQATRRSEYAAIAWRSPRICSPARQTNTQLAA
eukprot:15433214-Alexandrium_andersonii.AAC.1